MGTPATVVDGVVRVGWADPASRNAIGSAGAAGIGAALDRAGADPATRVVVLGAGQSPFCSGWDVRDLAGIDTSSPEATAAYFRAGRELLARLADCPVPVVAVVAGAALGFGCSLLAHADVVLAADDARFGLPEIGRGFPPATVAPELLDVLGPRALGVWALTGRRVGADDARAAGLVHDLVPAAELEAEAAAVVASLAGAGGPLLRETKALLRDLAPLDPARRRRHGVAVAVRHFTASRADGGAR